MMSNLNILLVVGSCLLSVASCLLEEVAHQEDVLRARQILCRPELCPDNEVHVGCFNDKKYGRKCKKGTISFHVNGGLKLGILHQINMLRNYVASGAGRFKVAARMPMMNWDNDLQRLADLQARQCDDSAKFCANTVKYNYVATIEMHGQITKYTNVEKMVLNRYLPVLFTDVLDCRMDKEGRLLSKKKGSCVGHYIPLIEDRGSQMGCAIRLKGKDKELEKPKKKSTESAYSVNMTLICHFSRANVNSQQHYEKSKFAAEKCITGSSQLYLHLCHQMEMVDANSLLDDTKVSFLKEMGKSGERLEDRL